MMNIIPEYKNLSCYTKMNDDYRKSFDRLVDVYGELLEKGFLNGSTANGPLYTLHNFNHHCFNLFKIISKLFDSGGAYTHISERELYLLNLAVLFHDISMSVNKNWKREMHSKQSAEYVSEQYGNSSSALCRENALLRPNDINVLNLLITAHSDVKDNSVNNSLNGLKNPSLKKEIEATSTIRAKLLAGILRLADEFDITNERLGAADFEEQLDQSTATSQEIESYEHWKRLHYFSSLTIDGNDVTIINISTDDEYVGTKIEQGDETNVIKAIVEKQLKLNEIVQEIVNVAFKEYQQFQAFMPIKGVCVKSLNPKISELILDEIQKQDFAPTGVASLVPVTQEKSFFKNEIDSPKHQSHPETGTQHSQDVGQTTKTDEFLQTALEPINVSVQTRITETVNKKNALKSGHYLLNAKYCSCDWVDTHDIIETCEISELCIKILVNHFKMSVHTYKKCIILGLDTQGAILASKIAFQLQLPFSYAIPAKAFSETGSLDKELNVDEYNEIVIVTDAITTWETINTVIEHYKLSGKVARIYTVFWRKPDCELTIPKELVEKTFALNSEFPVHIIPRCAKYNTNLCLAHNKKRGV